MNDRAPLSRWTRCDYVFAALLVIAAVWVVVR